MTRFRLGSVLGIPIDVGVSFLLVLPLVAYLIGSQVDPAVGMLNGLLGAGIEADALTASISPWLLGAVAAVGLFAGVVLHELGHSLVARRYGVAIESITLWFLGGIARFGTFPDDWRQELAIAVAGPAVSVVLGGLCYVAFTALPTDASAARFVVGYLAVLNIVLAGFNLLPGFPMDGGRVLRALLSRNRSRLEATRLAAQVGKGFAVLLAVAGVLLVNVFWVAIALFIYMGATGEARQAVLSAALDGLAVEDIMTGADELHTVTPATSIESLLDRMVRERHTGYPVLSEGSLVGLVTLEDAESVDRDERGSTMVGEVMSAGLRTVSPSTEAAEAIDEMHREDVGRLPVVAKDGSLVGLISRTDIMTVFQIIRHRQSSAVTDRPIPD